MPKLKDNQVPSYRLHKQSGQAVVTLSGRDFLLGKHGSVASKQEYRRLTAEWLAARGAPPSVLGTDLTVTELVLLAPRTELWMPVASLVEEWCPQGVLCKQPVGPTRDGEQKCKRKCEVHEQPP